MARRSLLKRLLRQQQVFSKYLLNKGRNAEASFNHFCNEYAGPQATQAIRDAENYDDMIQNKRAELFNLRIAVLPEKLRVLKGELADFGQNMMKPGDITVGMVYDVSVVIFFAILAFIVGEKIGRWDYDGYDNEEF
ncbi:cbiD [Acrasis kona]|uniref:CbiD n=1 Tax=Acrasis kona TaxID=1008807 RepID=A0AAW2YUP2_9EUKA